MPELGAIMKTGQRIVILLTVLMGLLSLPLGGCENKLTRENYDKIQVGMSVDQVTAILGPGEKIVEGAGKKLAEGMLGDITMAQQRQNQNQIKQGLGDLVKNRDAQTQREAEGGAPPAHPASQPQPRSGAPSATIAQVPPTPAAPPGRPPVRDRWIWKADRIEITVDFSDDRVTTKNQDGL
ncbi:MAG: hypothetical protein JNK16_14815 [Phycisphaerales bacterium]|nr:hypothetical protein [Phycisphaerales bacterium]